MRKRTGTGNDFQNLSAGVLMKSVADGDVIRPFAQGAGCHETRPFRRDDFSRLVKTTEEF